MIRREPGVAGGTFRYKRPDNNKTLPELITVMYCFIPSLTFCSNFSLLILFINTNRFLLDVHFIYLLSLTRSVGVLRSGMCANFTCT